MTETKSSSWNPLDQASFYSLEKFEAGQFAITEPLLHSLLQSLIAAQVLIVKSARRLRRKPKQTRRSAFRAR